MKNHPTVAQIAEKTIDLLYKTRKDHIETKKKLGLAVGWLKTIEQFRPHAEVIIDVFAYERIIAAYRKAAKDALAAIETITKV